MATVVNIKLCVLLVCLVAVLACEEHRGAVPRECGAFEVYLACGPSCEKECATLGQPCLIRHIRCPDGCYCVEGYARDSKGKCIPVRECNDQK